MLEKKASVTLFVDIASQVLKVWYKQGRIQLNVVTVLKEQAAIFLFPLLPLQDGDTDLCEILLNRCFTKFIHILK